MAEFTSREKDIIKLIVEEGITNKDIADRFGITEGTIKQTLKNIFNKLGIKSRELLIIKYYKAALNQDNKEINFDKIIAKVI